MRIFAAMVLLCLASLGAEAKQSPYPVTPFEGDKYSARQAQMGADVARSVQIKRAREHHPSLQKYYRKNRYLKSSSDRNKRWRASPTPIPRDRPHSAPRQVPIFAPLADPGAIEPLATTAAPTSFGEGVRQVIKRVIGRPSAWCGWWLGQHLGMPSRHLWLARNWASVGSSAGGPRVGAIVVWRHHVGLITGHNSAGWVVKSGNDGHRVRERVRSLAGAIAFRSSS